MLQSQMHLPRVTLPHWAWLTLAVVAALLAIPVLLAAYGHYLAYVFGWRVMLDFFLPEIA